MSNKPLQSPKESVPALAALFQSIGGDCVYLSVREDICFGDNWLGLGEVALKPAQRGNDEEESALLEEAVRFGFYEWRTRRYADLQKDALEHMGFSEENGSQADSKATDKTRRALQAVIDVAARQGLLFPTFDPDMLASMPFLRPTTVVADTNAVGKGGVDFLVKFLCPMARLKVPAVVAMEILNQSDAYFGKRRKCLRSDEIKPKQKPSMLLDHVVSQAGQRGMLRFELHSDIEVERTSLFSDPLRNAFAPDKESREDWPDLNLSAPIRSYCDRLILETVRQHLSTVTPGHPVMLMTGDEGLARMALAEGIQPFFFHAGRPAEVYGQVLTGTRFHPFSGKLFSVPLQDMLWELAVTFGNARLASADGLRFFSVCAIDQDLKWQPFHARDDLLRVEWGGFEPQQAQNLQARSTSGPFGTEQASVETDTQAQKPDSSRKKPSPNIIRKKPSKPRRKLGPFNPDTVYRFDLSRLIGFIPNMLEKNSVPLTMKGTSLEGLDRRTLSKYMGFLMVGGFISETETGIEATDSMQRLWDALKVRDIDAVLDCFRSVPSLREFLDRLHDEKRIEVDTRAPERQRPSYTYIQIAELCGRALQIPQDAIYGTFNNPSASEFVDPAMKAYEKIRKGEEYVLTGLWLESLVRDYGIHPVKARDRLAEAQAAGMIERFTQGSTPDTRFENHTLAVLQVENGRPTVAKVGLYHGDFIIPGKASVSIRLERK